MIAGLEGQHAWIPPGQSSPAVILNRPIADDGSTEIWPCFKLKRISGLYSLGEPQDVRDNKVGGDGEIARLGRRRGRTVVYEGKIMARSRLELLQARDVLTAAFQDMSAEGRMNCSWHPLNVEFDGEATRYFKGKVLTCEVIDEQISQRHERPFVISIRQSDPRYFLAGGTPDGV